MLKIGKFHGIFLGATIALLSMFVAQYILSAGQNKNAQAHAISPTPKTSSLTPTPTSTITPAPQKTLTFRTSASGNGIFSDGVSVTLPTNIQAGDLLIAVAGTNGPKTSWYTPAGWTFGTNSNSIDTQGLFWWWKVADGSEAGQTVTFKSAQWEDGGVAVNVYQGQGAGNPIAGVGRLTKTDNDGVGNVIAAPVAGVSLGSPVNAVSLLFATWQETPATFAWPTGFGFESTASDGFASVDIAEALYSNTSDNFPGYTLSLSPAQAVVQTLQVLITVH